VWLTRIETLQGQPTRTTSCEQNIAPNMALYQRGASKTPTCWTIIAAGGIPSTVGVAICSDQAAKCVL
jgi:hypothetical protein